MRLFVNRYLKSSLIYNKLLKTTTEQVFFISVYVETKYIHFEYDSDVMLHNVIIENP